MKATKPIDPKTIPPMRFAPLKTGMPFFELISRHRRAAKTWGLTLVASRCHDSIRNGVANFQNQEPRSPHAGSRRAGAANETHPGRVRSYLHRDRRDYRLGNFRDDRDCGRRPDFFFTAGNPGPEFHPGLVLRR